MAGFWKRLFGGRTTAGAQEASDTETVVAASRAAESKRIESIGSSRFGDSARPGAAGEVEDTGPWFIGKTVAEIYQIRGVLGRGGMGIVYRGYDAATHRDIAVKVPLGKFVDDEVGRKRFTREAETWSGLIHPHIVHAFDVHDDRTTDYRPAIFMDYCDGGSLADRLRSGPQLATADALDIAIQVCWAMEFAHSQGLIHRDLKPGNVLLTKDGKALVSDFGLVRALDIEALQATQEEWQEQDEGVQASLTHGLAMGTPEYMPPEQWKGEAVQQSDVYAFGIMLYELVCGCRPFSASGGGVLCRLHFSVPPRNPRQINPRISEPLAELILACLAKQPHDRPETFGAIAAVLKTDYCRKTAAVRQKPADSELSRTNQLAQAWALHRLGFGCLRRCELEESLRNLRQAGRVFERLNDQVGQAVSLGGQATISRIQGKLDEAMGLFRQQEVVFRQHQAWDALATSLGNQAIVLRAQGKLDDAMGVWRQQETISSQIGQDEGIGTSLGHRALLFYAKGELREAMRLHKQEEAIFRKLGDQVLLQTSLGNQAVILTDWEKFDEAIDLLKQQEEICRKYGIDDALAASLSNQARVIYARGRRDDARKT